jgi:excinuclease ABC subunit A
MCPSTGISYQNPEPNLFSFNLGACAHCNGLGTVNEINVKKDNPNPGYLSKQADLHPLVNTNHPGYSSN